MNKFLLKKMSQSAKMIEGNDKMRAKKCHAEIKVVLDKDDATILPQFSIIGARIESTYLVVAKRQMVVQGMITDKMRAENTLVKIQVILDRYDCEIQPRLELTGANIRAGYQTVAKSRMMAPVVGRN